MFLYYTRGLVRWDGGVHCGDMGAMKAEGQARLEPPRNPGYAHTGYCVLAEGYVEHGWWAVSRTQMAMDSMGS